MPGMMGSLGIYSSFLIILMKVKPVNSNVCSLQNILPAEKNTKIKTLKLPLANFFLLKNSVFKTLCQEIIKVDTSIRSAGITNEDGIILHISHRKGIKPLLSTERDSICHHCSDETIYKT